MRRLLLLAGLAFVVSALAPSLSAAQAQVLAPYPSAAETFNLPHYVASPPGDTSRVFIVEGVGTVRLVLNGVLQPTPFLDISSDVIDRAEPGGCPECGLWSIAFAPDYATSGRFYVFYSRDDGSTATLGHILVIEEFQRSAADPNVADLASRRKVMEIPHTARANHNGGQLQFGPDGLLYISVGDGGAGQSNNAQDLTTRLGKLLRIDPTGTTPFEYSIPSGNPFADGPGGNADEIYSYGLRNPWRFSFDRLTGDLVLGDVGQAAWEELDYERKGGGLGANFGWNCFEGTGPYVNAPASCTPPLTNHTPPVLEYPNPGTGAAIAAGFVIRDGALPSLLGRTIYTDSFNGDLRTAVLAPGTASGDASLGIPPVDFPVSFGEDACAHIYLTSIAAGQVFRLEPSSGPLTCKPQPPAPQISATDPVSSANDNSPEVSGNAPAGSNVSLYDNADCSGTPLATGTDGGFASPGLTVSVADNSVTTLFATAEVGGVVSPCSRDPFNYVEDSTAREPADFNGDGFADLATGAPSQDIGVATDAGAVNVIYGSAGGLDAAGNQLWTQDSPGIDDAAETGDRFGAAVATGDFNRDGFTDLAVGAPSEGLGSQANAGAVNVIYGSASGLTSAGSQLWSQTSPGIIESSETGDNFGAALASGDINGDSRDDLAVGAPSEGIGSQAGAGAANVIYGATGGLDPAGNQLWSQSSAGIIEASEAGDSFGAAVAGGDLNGDGRADLTVGVPSESVGAHADAGALNAIYAGAAGLDAAGNQLWSQNSPAILDAAESGDAFGAALAVGDLNADGRDDLAAGAPSEAVGSQANAGAANVIYGAAGGLASAGNQLWSQTSAGITEASEAGDNFAAVLAAGDVNGDGRADLAVGVPSESVGPVAGAGAVNEIYGSSPAGLDAAGNQLWSQNTAGVLDASEPGDDFGAALASAAFAGL